MAFQKYIIYLILLSLPSTFLAQKLGFNRILTDSPHQNIAFSVPNNVQNQAFLEREKVAIKRATKNYIFFTQTPDWVAKNHQNGNLTDFFFEFTFPALLSDSARQKHYADSVHMGVSPLQDGYTGKGVILGIVDSGLDWDHPDFIDQYGNKRVIRYWDQSTDDAETMPEPYNYGRVWSREYIQQNSNTTTSHSDMPHGTTVTGMAGGNGLANGTNKGMAPDAEIVFVQSDFNKPNWTLTVADACDYIFKVADSLGKPAVINLSIGSALGSHDGTDPAGELMSFMAQEKRGRIIIGAAGNSGDRAPFHAQATIAPSDTNFIWFENNPNGALGENTVFFDLWSDVNDAQFSYSFGANKNGGDYQDVASTTYRFSQLNVGTPIYDTLWGAQGDRIATLEIYTEYEAGNYHLQGFFSKVDSTDYLLRFSTTGQGKYDLWSDLEVGMNTIVTEVPNSSVYPPIVNYVFPDSAQSIVSSWNCAPDIVSVANIRNRYTYEKYDGGTYHHANDTEPGAIALSSSRGPARSGGIKPDISASGEMSLSSAPMYMVNNPSAYSSMGVGGFHMRNNGTSMAAPIVSGIAALYLERCPKGSMEEFMQDLFVSAQQDNFTGNVPNNRFGYGKINALDLLAERNGNLKIIGDTAICQLPVQLSTNIPLQAYNWSTGAIDAQVVVSQPSEITLYGTDMSGCKIYADTVNVVQGSPLPNPTISLVGNTLLASEAPNYQWYRNDSPISGATQQEYTPTTYAYYSVAVQGPDNCKSFSNAFYFTSDLSEESLLPIHIYPNPTKSQLNIKAEGQEILAVAITTVEGKAVSSSRIGGNLNQINVGELASGIYLIKIQTNQQMKILSFFKE